MKCQVVLSLGGCVAAALLGAATPRLAAEPTAHARLAAAASSPAQAYTLRYIVFFARPKTRAVADQYRLTYPPVIDSGLSVNPRYDMNTTPDNFLRVLQADQSDYVFGMALVGSVPLHSGTPSQFSDGPNPADPYRATLNDTVTVTPNADGTLDFKSEGKVTYLALGGEDGGSAWSWNGENNELVVGRTYLWGAEKKPDGTVITWALCVLPGQQDQVPSAWKRRNGVPDGAAFGKQGTKFVGTKKAKSRQ